MLESIDKKRLRCVLPQLSIVLLIVSLPAYAESLKDRISVQGFGTLGAVYNDDDNVKYIRNSSQKDTKGGDITYSQDSRLGLQLTAQFSPALSITLQGISRFNLDNTFTPELSWAFVRYMPDADWTLRAGRLGLDIFFRSDSRDVGYSYLWARPPIDFYGQIILNTIEGVDVNKHFFVGQTSVDLKLTYGSLYDAAFSEDNVIIDISHSEVYGVITELEHGNLAVQASYFYTDQSQAKNYIAVAGPSGEQINLVVDGPTNITKYSTLSVGYDKGPWRAQLSMGSLRLKTSFVPDSFSAFASLGYRHKKLTPYILLSKIEPYSSNTAPGIEGKPNPTPDQSTIGIGLRYDIKPNIALKLQAEFIDSKRNNSAIWASESDAWDGDANIYSAVVDVVF